MKNHVLQNGRLLQTNKKWGALKQSQRTWIQEMTAKEHTAYIEKHGKLPMKKQKKVVLDKVYDFINEKNIWIPYGEYYSHVSLMIDRLNRKNPLFTPPTKKSTQEKPKILKAGIYEFPENVQLMIREKLMKVIKLYISQTRRVPSDKIREIHIKSILSSFNAKQWKPYGKKIEKNDVLINMYDEFRANLEMELKT